MPDEFEIGMEPPPRNNSKIPLPECSTIRKSIYGRAILSIDEGSYVESRCNSSTAHTVKVRSIYHSHSLNNRSTDDWTQKTDVACWHCCHQFDNPPVPIPKHYDTFQKCFVVYGNFCSLSCAKQYIAENSSFDWSQQISLFTKMALTLYNTSHVIASPPRLSLKMFGGPFSIDKFHSQKTEAFLVTAPFINSYMVVEEREITANVSSYATQTMLGNMRSIRRPEKPLELSSESVDPDNNPYTVFCQEQDAVEKASKKKKDQSNNAEKKAQAGTLEAFIR